MSFRTIFVTIARELFPFLKEALLEGQTFRVWLKTNWLTFAWLVNTAFLVLMIVHLSDLLTKAHRSENEMFGQVSSLRAPIEKMVARNKELAARNEQLASEHAELSLFKTTNEPKIEQYEQWMQRCGVNLDTGQCKAVRQPVRPARAKPTPTAPPPDINLPQPQPEQKPTFMQRIRKMLGGNKNKNEED